MSFKSLSGRIIMMKDKEQSVQAETVANGVDRSDLNLQSA